EVNRSAGRIQPECGRAEARTGRSWSSQPDPASKERHVPSPESPEHPAAAAVSTAPASVVPAAPAPSQRPAPDLAAELWPPAVGTGTERTGLRDRRLPAAALRSEAAETEETTAQTLVVLAARRHRRHRHCQRARRRGR